MRVFRWILQYTLVLLMALSSFVLALDDARLLREPDVYGNKIVFRYANDLWTVPVSGGLAARLTSHPGTESSPCFSPDGKWIAFTGEYDGNTDVYKIPSDGGEPIRLTYHPGSDTVTGWSNDGKNVLFISSRSSQHSRLARLWKVSVDGGMPEMFPIYKAHNVDMSADGKYLAYCPKGKYTINAWKRYRGGTHHVVWILNLDDLSVTEIKQDKVWNDSFPHWMGTDIYFISDRDRTMNLYKYNTLDNKTAKLTNFKDIDIKSFGLDKTNVIFEQNGYLHLLNPEDGKINQLKIDIPSELLETRPHFVNAEQFIESMDISPTGKRAVFEARGEILTVPTENGEIRNITNTPGKMERTPAWSPDGRWIAYFGEEKGEYVIKIVDQKGEGEPNIITIPEPTFFVTLVWSPDSKKLAFNDIQLNLYYVNIDDKKITKIDKDPNYFDYIYPVWSPDSEWIAYSRSNKNLMRSIYLYSLESGESTPITDDMSIADNPVFDRNGKYLYFYSCTDISLRLSWNELSDMLSKPTNNLYLIILNSVEPSPFIPESDEEIVKDQKKDKNGKKDNIKEESGKIKIDLSNIEKRIIPFDMPRGHYGNIQAGTENIFYYIAPGSRSRSADLHMYNIVSNKDEIILENVSNYMVSADGNKIMYKKRGAIAIADAGRPIITGKGKLNTTGIKTWMVPELEWKQILHEAWRFNRDMFYDPGMHGIDWSAMLKKYEVYLPYVGHRDDLNYVIQQLLSELAVGHCHAAGGELPQIDRVPGGLLGADYEIDSGFYRIKHIYEGESWNPDLRAPLNVPGVLVKEGDYILAVNGRELKAPCNIYSLFQNTAGKQVVLKVNDKPEMNGAREVTVVPIRNESDLRHRDWLDNTRKMVNKLTYGKVGYVYIPDTMRSGFDSFNRYYFSQLDKEGLIIDERYNGGGAFADYMVENMNRKIINWVQPRYGQSITIPGAANYGQKVMLISEMAGSGGDYLPFAFRAHKIGKIIGRTTWGGLVGVTGCPPLMDGGIVTSPNVGFVGLDGKFSIENEGVPPDIDIEIYPTDFKAGKDTQLLKAIEVIMEEIKDHKLPELKFDSFPRGR